MFIRLDHAIDSVGAKRVVLDTLEALFAGLPNQAILRAELRRLFRWLKDRGMTAIITGERGETSLTRYGLEEYVADCVILLDHRIDNQSSTRRLRVVKYRGSAHGTNEYPFLIGEPGCRCCRSPRCGSITRRRTERDRHRHRSSSTRCSAARAVYRGSSMLVSGSAGTGKSSIGRGLRRRGVPARRTRADVRLRGVGGAADPQHAVDRHRSGSSGSTKGLLEVHATRPTMQGLEQHLVQCTTTCRRFKPSVVVVDPISNLGMDDDDSMLKPTLMRLIDFLKQQQITALFTSLTKDGGVELARRRWAYPR